MNGRLWAAMHCLDELRGHPTMHSCHAAALLAGVSLIDADECDQVPSALNMGLFTPNPVLPNRQQVLLPS